MANYDFVDDVITRRVLARLAQLLADAAVQAGSGEALVEVLVAQPSRPAAPAAATV